MELTKASCEERLRTTRWRPALHGVVCTVIAAMLWSGCKRAATTTVVADAAEPQEASSPLLSQASAALVRAATEGDPKQLAELLEAGAASVDPDAVSRALIAAAGRGRTAAVRSLLAVGARVDGP